MFDHVHPTRGKNLRYQVSGVMICIMLFTKVRILKATLVQNSKKAFFINANIKATMFAWTRGGWAKFDQLLKTTSVNTACDRQRGLGKRFCTLANINFLPKIRK